MHLRELPADLVKVREAVLRALSPIKPPDSKTEAPRDFLFSAKRTEAGRKLPPYYLVYFVLVELAGFRNIGQFEKISWSVPLDYKGRAFLVEHRKMGLGVFAQELPGDEPIAAEIAGRIQAAVGLASPFFDWLATEAVAASHVNVVNRAWELYARFDYLRDLSSNTYDEADRRKNEVKVDKGQTKSGMPWISTSRPAWELEKQGSWLALSAVEAFFSWTEHVFIHLAVLQQRVTTAEGVADLASANWADKYKTAVDISDPVSKRLFDRLLNARRDLRNYVAHGAFGKQGEAFTFHSGAGAVPVMLPHKAGARTFKLGYGLRFDGAAVLSLIEEFIDHLWSGERAPARIYLQETDLPIVLTMAVDGTFERAMASTREMQEFVRHLGEEADRAANMDW